jgi:hypothetical protein
MAYIRNPLKEEAPGQQSGGVVGTDGQSITGDQGGKPVSNWTNLNEYVQGNQGTGGQIADKMLEQGNKDVNAAGVANSEFEINANKQVDEGTKRDTGGYADLFSSGNVAGATDEQKNAYGAWKNTANYAGPNNASETNAYGNASQATNQAKNQAAKSATQEGQYGLAKESLGKGNQNYNGGMSMLDTVLARQAGGGQKLDDFNTKNTSANIQKGLDTASQNVNSYIGGAAARGQTAQDKATSALQNRLGSMQSELSAREAANKNSGDDMYEMDQSLADYANDSELQALNNLSGFGATMDQGQRNELLARSGRSKKTVRQGNAETAPERNAQEALSNQGILPQILARANGPTTKSAPMDFSKVPESEVDMFGNPWT